jgi:hypothetical protein
MTKTFFCIVALASILKAANPNDGGASLWYDKPAADWLSALPVGNGSLGGMIFGGVSHEQIQFNEQTLWTGDETIMGAYQPFGDLFLDFPESAPIVYRRELCISDAVHRTAFTVNGVKFLREVFSSYPDQVIDLSVIGTDPARAKGVSDKSIDHYNATWFGKIHAVDKTVPLGYQAPPLDGVWATAPYLHNGSVPTVYDLLNSGGRPARFLRHATTGVENFDPLHLGWKVRRLKRPSGP